jgi:V/A-type H+/Na+-transporting ATPase subunit E
MSLDGILDKINRNAEEKVEAIREQGRRKREETLSRAQARARDIKERILKEATEKADMEKRRTAVSAQLEYRRETLKEKQNLIEDCFQAALEQLLNLPEEEYRSLLRNMLLRTAPAVAGRVAVSARDQGRIDQAFLDSVNQELKASGKEGHLEVDGTSADIKGGFLLRTEGVEVDCSFGTLLGLLRDDVQTEVAAILFGKKK